MPEWLVEHAQRFAIAAVVGAVLFVAVLARGAWMSWRRARITHRAAMALLDVHTTRLEETLHQFDDGAGTLADDGDALAEALAELQADAAHLRWMVGRIGEQRKQLARELYELVLPTSSGKARAGDPDA